MYIEVLSVGRPVQTTCLHPNKCHLAETVTASRKITIKQLVLSDRSVWGVGHKATIQMQRPDLGVCARAATPGPLIQLSTQHIVMRSYPAFDVHAGTQL